MKNSKWLISCLLAILPFCSFGQSGKTKILGSWVCDSIAFLSPMEDSANLIRNIKNSTITFEPGDKVTVKIGHGSDQKVYSSSYSMSQDEKTLTQNGIDSKILKLTEDSLTLKVEQHANYISHFRKVKIPH